MMAENEGSDEASESELLDKSLSVWKGKSGVGKEKFEPIPLDLHTGSSLGQYECVKNLITRGEIDLDKRNRGGWTALMYACYIGHDSIVNLLLEAGVCVNIRNFKGETPLMLASSCGNESVGYYLCTQGAELEAHDERGWTALFHATYSGHQNMVRFLLQEGANMNAVEKSMGMTPFMEAASEGHEIILQLFLQHGVNVNAKADNGDTARSLALINGNMKIVSLIDNHVMPITSLRAEAGLEPDFSSSDDALSRNRRVHSRSPRGKPSRGRGGGPSIRDGPEAIARLIDRTRHTDKDNFPDVVPKGYVTFPQEGAGEPDPQPQKLSFRDVTSPINPQDYTLDSSGGKESFDIEDDTNAFSKTGALTIKSSSGSSGGLAAALGIRREDSLDSDEFPHDSSCDSHPREDSGDSSSEEGTDEKDDIVQVSEMMKANCDTANSDIVKNKDVGVIKGMVKVKHKKSKDNLTTDKVNEIEEVKNSVFEWIESVNKVDGTPVGEDIVKMKENVEMVGEDLVKMTDNIATSVAAGSEVPAATDISRLSTNLHEHVSEHQHQKNHPSPKLQQYESQLQGPISLSGQYPVSQVQDPSQQNYMTNTPSGYSNSQGPDPSQQNYMTNTLSGYPKSQVPDPSQQNYMTNTPSGYSSSMLVQQQHLHEKLAQYHASSLQNVETNPSHVHQSENCISTVHDTSNKPSQIHIQNMGNIPITSNPVTTGPSPSWSVSQENPSDRGAVTPTPGIPLGPSPSWASNENPSGRTLPGPHVLSSNIGPQTTEYTANISPVSALSILNTNSSSVVGSANSLVTNPYPIVTENPAEAKTPLTALPVTNSNQFNVGPSSNYDNQQTVLPVQAPPGFQAPFNTYQMFPANLGSPAKHEALKKDSMYSSQFTEKMKDSPPDLPGLLEQLGLSKYLQTFEEQDVDLQVFLSLTDNDLKEIGIKLFGPRKKMMNAIARWHSKARPALGDLEQAYADRLEGEMQEMGVQLQMAVEEIEKLKAQVKQEQQLRNVTETCLMEERAAWQHVQRLVMDTRQQCEDFKDVLRKLRQYVNEAKARIPPEPVQSQKRPIRGAGTVKEDIPLDKNPVTAANDKLSNETLLRKLEYYTQEVHLMLGNITGNTDRLLGRNTTQSPERDFAERDYT